MTSLKLTTKADMTTREVEGKLIPQNPEHPNCFRNVTEHEWADAFHDKDLTKFNKIFHPNVTQSASTSPYTNFGVDEVSQTFAWASNFYSRCDFVYQASAEMIEFLEFDLTTKNKMKMTGMTVLTKGEDGKVIKVFNGHRNLMETVLFSEHFVRGPKNKGIVSLFHDKALSKYGIENRYPRNPVGFSTVAAVTEIDYIDAFKTAKVEAFASICDESATLSSSYVTKTVCGKEDVAQCLSLMAGFYEHCTFTTQATYQDRTYLLYNGRLRNGMIVSDGFLILVRNDSGKIIEVLDNPIPMHAGTLISAYIARNHPDPQFAKAYLYSESLLQKAVEKYSLDNVYGENTRNLSSFRGFIAKFFLQV